MQSLSGRINEFVFCRCFWIAKFWGFFPSVFFLTVQTSGTIHVIPQTTCWNAPEDPWLLWASLPRQDLWWRKYFEWAQWSSQGGKIRAVKKFLVFAVSMLKCPFLSIIFHLLYQSQWMARIIKFIVGWHKEISRDTVYSGPVCQSLPHKDVREENPVKE